MLAAYMWQRVYRVPDSDFWRDDRFHPKMSLALEQLARLRRHHAGTSGRSRSHAWSGKASMFITQYHASLHRPRHWHVLPAGMRMLPDNLPTSFWMIGTAQVPFRGSLYFAAAWTPWPHQASTNGRTDHPLSPASLPLPLNHLFRSGDIVDK